MINTLPNFTLSYPADNSDVEIDLLIACCGYESRSTFIPQRTQSVRDRIAVDMGSSGVLEYDSNRKFFVQEGYRLDGQVEESIDASIRKAMYRNDNSSRTVLIDISSMSRRVAGNVLVSALTYALQGDIIDIMYAFSDYIIPPAKISPVTYSGPINATFAGNLMDASLPVALILGLGAESGRAVGCVDRIEPSEVFAFLPVGRDHRFDIDAIRVNEDLMSIPGGTQTLSYLVSQPADAIEKLTSLALGLAIGHRSVIVPFGPKIFAACAMIVALQQRGRISVWRVSAGARDIPINRLATGHISMLRLSISADDSVSNSI